MFKCGFMLLLISTAQICLAGGETTQSINQGSGVDTTGNGQNDIFIQGGGGNPPTFMVSANAAQKKGYFGGTAFSSLSCDEAINASGTYNTFNFLPEPGEVFFVRDSDEVNYAKVRFNSVNPGVSINLTWEPLGACNAGPVPVSSFTHTSYDLIAFFTDTSTENPNAWSWDFAGQGSSGAANPIFMFSAANTYSVDLTASNTAGAGNTASQSVTVSEQPSVTSSTGFDLDGDTNNDLTILNAPSGCSGSNAALQTSNGATYSFMSVDYRNLDENDIPPAITGTGAFCSEEGSSALFNPFVLKTADGAVYKFWTPRVGNTDARMEFALLTAAPPEPPVSSFTHSTYDKIAFFTDTSTGGPGAWDWNFGDGSGTSSQQNPSYFYATESTFSVNMTASNNGGPGNTAMDNVTVSEQPSVIVAVGNGYDFDGDQENDLLVVTPNGCGGDVTLRPAKGATWTSQSIDYRTATQVPANINSTSDFCGTEGVGGLFDIRYVLTSNNSVYKFWTPEITSGQIRMEFAALQESTVPGAPTNLSGLIDDMSVAISFTAPADDGGSAITSYDADCGAGSSDPVVDDSTAIVVTGLTNGVEYFCTVTASNPLGQGPPSVAISVIPDFVIFRDGFNDSGTRAANARALIDWLGHKQVAEGHFGLGYNTTINAFTFAGDHLFAEGLNEAEVVSWFEMKLQLIEPHADFDDDGLLNAEDSDPFGLFD